MSHVVFKKALCRLVEFKKCSCCPVEFKKCSCRHVTMSNVRNVCVSCYYVFRAHVACHKGLKCPCRPVDFGGLGPNQALIPNPIIPQHIDPTMPCPQACCYGDTQCPKTLRSRQISPWGEMSKADPRQGQRRRCCHGNARPQNEALL